MRVVNPKRTNESIDIKSAWYNYYAGYSHAFTQSIIDSVNLPKDSVILDPWNGAGTTTLLASMNGYQSIGIDLNPVMKIIAMAKQTTSNDLAVILNRSKKIRANVKVPLWKDDPLLGWFDMECVNSIRRIEKIILMGKLYKSTEDKVNSMDVAHCLMYTVLFNCVREYLSPFIPSNPTWVKKPKTESEKITASWVEFKRKYIFKLKEITKGIAELDHCWPDNLSNIKIGSSTKLKVDSTSIDLALSSPPYCTRIDYGVATSPELAILCVNGSLELDSIRRELMGTTTVPKTVDESLNKLGSACVQFLESVKAHDSKASKTYYFKNFVQYFKSLNESMDEIYRVLKYGARFVCVVQDSYYKDLHCDLPKLVIEMSEAKGLLLKENIRFESKKNMSNLNLKTKKYRSHNKVFESVLIFEKESNYGK
ncbi:DNA methyltransferase [Pseudoalteromonas distincta]|uniref:DNA methyltransferase n=1 Tax=Pseudoalteromonas distincta TaxID=77608 RepID=A0ABT9GAV0_9GAMM|nr:MULTISPECIES: DNA methyltransferase [Pseudoalteromonas distincta group]MDP4483001.1 DNA methyltransferase [Pseudoalteromonas elyakovii]